MLNPDKIIEIFVKVDDFFKEFDVAITKHRLESNDSRARNRQASLSDSEIITILIAFHSGHFTNLKHFYMAISVLITRIISPTRCLIIASLSCSNGWQFR